MSRRFRPCLRVHLHPWGRFGRLAGSRPQRACRFIDAHPCNLDQAVGIDLTTLRGSPTRAGLPGKPVLDPDFPAAACYCRTCSSGGASCARPDRPRCPPCAAADPSTRRSAASPHTVRAGLRRQCELRRIRPARVRISCGSLFRYRRGNRLTARALRGLRPCCHQCDDRSEIRFRSPRPRTPAPSRRRWVSPPQPAPRSRALHPVHWYSLAPPARRGLELHAAGGVSLSSTSPSPPAASGVGASKTFAAQGRRHDGIELAVVAVDIRRNGWCRRLQAPSM